jgi:hydrogenase maturation protease
MNPQDSNQPGFEDALPALLIGVGNEILCDDGIGPRAVRALEPRLNPKRYTCACGPSDTLALADIMRLHSRVILVDAEKSGKSPPGTVHKYIDLLAAPVKHTSALHDMSLAEALSLLRILEGGHEPIVTVIGIEIFDDTTISDQLSPVLEPKFNRIVEDILALLKMS